MIEGRDSGDWTGVTNNRKAPIIESTFLTFLPNVQKPFIEDMTCCPLALLAVVSFPTSTHARCLDTVHKQCRSQQRTTIYRLSATLPYPTFPPYSPQHPNQKLPQQSTLHSIHPAHISTPKCHADSWNKFKPAPSDQRLCFFYHWSLHESSSSRSSSSTQ